MRLSDFSQGRDNNFNLIRIIAALAVLVTHSFALATGTPYAEPFRESIGMTMGDIAVDVFFVTSGFLVTASLLNRQSTMEFIWARALRIFPALWVMLILTVFFLGLFFTSWSIMDYLSSRNIYIYLATNSTLITHVDFVLPGVFTGVPYKYFVNGSIWTMPFEVRMYAILAIIWFTLRITSEFRLPAFKLIIVALAIVAGFYLLDGQYFNIYATQEFVTQEFAKFFFMFFTGAAFYVLRKYIVLSPWLFWFFVISLSLAAVDKKIFFVVYVLVIAYILLYMAYIPSGLVRKYNRLGDYSYGVYIYAWPIQQSVAQLFPGISVLQMIMISAATTLLLAAFSWHLLERRALSLKANYIGRSAFNPANALVQSILGNVQKISRK